MLEKGLVQKSIMLIFLLLFSYACSSSKAMIKTNQAVSEKNILTFINHSAEDALVKLVGPSRKLVEVPNRRERTVSIAGGEYQIYVRYGNGQGYRYARGEVFRIVDHPSGYTVARLTLHGVINGNYRTYGSSEDEFNRR